MLNRTVKQLTDEKFQEIYTSFEFRNQVAHAHQYAKQGGEVIGRKTCSFPVEYIVTEAQIAEAQKELSKWKEFTFQKHENDLLFVSMGSQYAERYEDDVCNHRIRTTFLNSKGEKCFIEFGTGLNVGETRIDHAIFYATDTNNYHGLESRSKRELPKFTKSGLLALINSEFDCKFKNIVIDKYNISTHDKDIICKSPQ